MKELDILLTRYLEGRYPVAPAEEQNAFRHLLDVQDPLIYAYCLGQEPAPAHLALLIERITVVPPAVQ